LWKISTCQTYSWCLLTPFFNKSISRQSKRLTLLIFIKNVKNFSVFEMSKLRKLAILISTTFFSSLIVSFHKKAQLRFSCKEFWLGFDLNFQNTWFFGKGIKVALKIVFQDERVKILLWLFWWRFEEFRFVWFGLIVVVQFFWLLIFKIWRYEASIIKIKSSFALCLDFFWFERGLWLIAFVYFANSSVFKSI